MRKNRYFTIILSLFALAFTACDDNLDVEPEQSLPPEVAVGTPGAVQSILANAYAEARDNDGYAGYISVASELIANEGDLSWNGTYVGPAEFDEKAILADNGFVQDIWMNAYQIINQTNIVLANLDVFEDEDERSRVEGEAKFLRGLAYFDLVRLFAKPYKMGENGSSLGVPVVLEPVVDEENITYPARSTVEEVYTQVLADLNDAAQLMPPTNSYFAGQYAAQALLARVYLQRGNYEAARDAADSVIENSPYTLVDSFEDAFNNSENTPEDILAWQVTSQDANINSFNEFWGGYDFGGRSGDPDISILDDHFSIYDDEMDDRGLFFYETDRGIATLKWQSQYANIPFIRLAEMYLIRAEANERLGTEVGASPLEDINVLRERANATLFDSVDLETILMERRRELAFEGFALFDAKRLGDDIGDIPFDANRLVLPIPLREMDANPELVQNPGY